MLYTITRPFAKITLGIYFRKIFISNRSLLPADKPILLAANHPTAFIEPCILACWLDKPLSFIARGDLYTNNVFLRKLYDWYHMTPVFRLEDTGYGNLKNNYRSFERCFDTLKRKKTLMILAEGRVKHEKRLRPLKKGTARIVFGALEKYGDLDIHVVPVGVNYTDPDNFRSLAMIRFGEPIRATDYTELYEANPAKAINKLTRDLAKRLKSHVIHVKEETDEELSEQLFTLMENDLQISIPPAHSENADLLEAEKAIADYINHLKPEKKDALKARVSGYYQELANQGISDAGLVNRRFYTTVNSILVFLGWLPAMAGRILNKPPLLVGTWIANRIAPSIEFRASSAIVFSAVLYLIYLFTISMLLVIAGAGWGVLLVLIFPLSGYFYLLFNELYRKWSAGRKTHKLAREEIADLLKTREKIVEALPGKL